MFQFLFSQAFGLYDLLRICFRLEVGIICPQARPAAEKGGDLTTSLAPRSNLGMGWSEYGVGFWPLRVKSREMVSIGFDT